MSITSPRELGSYFVSPIAYVVIAIYLASVGGLFGFILYFRASHLRLVFMHGVVIFVHCAYQPVLTMRCYPLSSAWAR
jgi:hypothetical protein